MKECAEAPHSVHTLTLISQIFNLGIVQGSAVSDVAAMHGFVHYYVPPEISGAILCSAASFHPRLS